MQKGKDPADKHVVRLDIPGVGPRDVLIIGRDGRPMIRREIMLALEDWLGATPRPSGEGEDDDTQE